MARPGPSAEKGACVKHEAHGRCTPEPAGGPQVPESLKAQLKIGGRLVIPVGADQSSQELVRVIRVSKDKYRGEDIADVRFVPLIGEEGWDKG